MSCIILWLTDTWHPGSFDATGAASFGQDQRLSAGAGLAGQRQQRSEAAVEPFAEELRGCVRDLKAQLAERDTSLAATSEQLETLRAEIAAVNSVKESAESVCCRFLSHYTNYACSSSGNSNDIPAMPGQCYKAVEA